MNTDKNNNTVTCPKCKATIPLTDAVTHGIREQLENDFAAQRRALQEACRKAQRNYENRILTVKDLGPGQTKMGSPADAGLHRRSSYLGDF